jgi:hypothetical protein
MAIIMHCEKRGTMKSVTTVGNRKERHRSLIFRFFALAAAACVAVSLLAGCSGRHPGETRAEVNRRHDRALRLNSEMMLSDLDKALMLDRPSRLTDKRIP